MNIALHHIVLGFLGLCSSIQLNGQCLYVDEPIPMETLGDGGTTYESRYGRYMPTQGIVRLLVVLLEVDYQTPG